MAVVAFNKNPVLANRKTLGAQRDRLIQANPPPDLRGLANYCAGTVINEEAFTYLGPG